MKTIWQMFGLAIVATVLIWAGVLGLVFLVQLILSIVAQ